MFYRLRASLAYRKFQWITRDLDRTPPLRSHAGARCEVHTMLGAKDVTMYILAIKSLLSFVDDLAVVVHSDGTLTEDHRGRVAKHIAGVQFVPHAEAEVRALVYGEI